jgi:hypothetical protein
MKPLLLKDANNMMCKNNIVLIISAFEEYLLKYSK